MGLGIGGFHGWLVGLGLRKATFTSAGVKEGVVLYK